MKFTDGRVAHGLKIKEVLWKRITCRYLLLCNWEKYVTVTIFTWWSEYEMCIIVYDKKRNNFLKHENNITNYLCP